LEGTATPRKGKARKDKERKGRVRSLTEDVEGAHCSAVGETNAAIAILLDLWVAEKRKEEARRECNSKTQRGGCVLGWGGETRLDRGSSL
jgi:hypothetical protein